MRYSELDLPEDILKAVERMGFVELTEVQEKAIPVMLDGRDLIAKAPTGTGKTCAFGIPLLLELDRASNTTQALILAPTRELAMQITGDLRDLAHYMPDVRIACLYGGEPIQKQLTQLKKGAHIIVATPGRLQDHMKRRTAKLSYVTRVVLDEADEMLDMGFYKDVVRILESLNNKKQLGMFSATMSRPVMDIGWIYQRDAEEIVVRPVEESKPRITQYSLACEGPDKVTAVADIIKQNDFESVMVFCNTKYATTAIAGQLAGLGLDADCLNGDMSQTDRGRIMNRFKERKLRILVCTDVAARGIDVDDLDAVVNYDVPGSNEYYTHRIGRTGRAQREGVSFILYMPDEERRLKEMLRLTRNTVIPVRLDENRRLTEIGGEK
jgi:ATP-dependent RNA helicase DeaD